MLKSLLYKLIARFAKYKVMDNYKTEITCYTFKGALSWLSSCAPQAVIYNVRTGDVVAARNQGVK